jgi:abortive infection bacteriophage resistance protein
VKEFKTYEDQVELLLSRCMVIEDRDAAITQLRRVNYYRLSGYWYPFRKLVGTCRGRSRNFST